MSALPEHYIIERKGINWLNERVQIHQFTAEMGFARLGLYNPAGVIGHYALFNRLPDFVLTSKLTPAAKLIYADIFSWCFAKDSKGKPVIREYFYSYRTIADRVGLTRQGVDKAIKELIKGGWISNGEQARDSSRVRHKLVPLNTVATSDATTMAADSATIDDSNGESQSEVPDPDASDDPVQKYKEARAEYLAKEAESCFDSLDDCLEDTEIPVASLGEETTKPGIPMPWAVARRLTMVPLFLTVQDLHLANIIHIPEVLVYGLMMKLAQPFYFASDVKTAAATGLHRSTVKRAIKRLEVLRMINSSDHGYYVVAHPILNPEPKPQFNQLSSLIKQEKTCLGKH